MSEIANGLLLVGGAVFGVGGLWALAVGVFWLADKLHQAVFGPCPKSEIGNE